MGFMRRPKVQAAPAPVDPADTANRVANERDRRIRTGGRASTFLSQTVADAAQAPAPSLTGIG